MLDEREAQRFHGMRDSERHQVVLAALDHVSRPQLDELERVRQPAEDAPERREEILQPARPVHRQRQLPATQGERLQHPGQAEVVVGVKVRDEDLAQLHEPHAGAQQLALRPLPAVEEQPLAAPSQEQRGRRPLRGRNGA